jgi:hypothetical protein
MIDTSFIDWLQRGATMLKRLFRQLLEHRFDRVIQSLPGDFLVRVLLYFTDGATAPDRALAIGILVSDHLHSPVEADRGKHGFIR